MYQEYKVLQSRKLFKKRLTLYSLSFKVMLDDNQNITDYQLRSAKPCRSCTDTLMNYNIKRIMYSTHDETIESLCLDADSLRYSVISTGSILTIDINRTYQNFFPRYFESLVAESRCMLIIPRKGEIFRISAGDIMVLRFWDQDTEREKFKKIMVTNQEIDKNFQTLIRGVKELKRNFLDPKNRSNNKIIRFYRSILPKAKTYCLIEFDYIN